MSGQDSDNYAKKLTPETKDQIKKDAQAQNKASAESSKQQGNIDDNLEKRLKNPNPP
ncbi:unnamed protein product, partial [Didymodactylos carnosus]